MKKRIFLLLLVVVTILSVLNLCGCEADVSSDPVSVDRPLVINHTVTFKTNGGTPIEKKKVDKIEKAPVTEREGYLFNGWYLDETLENAVVFPLQIEDDLTLYARWLKIKDEDKCRDCTIKLDSDFDYSATYLVTPSGFDFAELQRKGVKGIKITVSYEVYYKKDYDVLWDIGYMGAPKYEVYIIDSEGLGVADEDVEAKKSATTKRISMSVSLSDLKNESIKLIFSTNNVQNKIYFKNIVVSYECYK